MGSNPTLNRVFLLRLALNGVAAGLLLFAFSYYWQGNAAHEVAGTAMFILLVVHGAFHRRWFVTLVKKRPNVQRSKFNIALTFVLLIGMFALLATSLVISETLFADFRLDNDFTARQIHVGIAYWLLLIVAIHLGLRWPLLMATVRRVFGLMEANAVRTAVLRLVATAIALQGVYSALALNLRYRLLFQMTLDWWSFEESVVGFFGHCLAVMGLCIFLVHYTMQWLGRIKRRVGHQT